MLTRHGLGLKGTSAAVACQWEGKGTGEQMRHPESCRILDSDSDQLVQLGHVRFGHVRDYSHENCSFRTLGSKYNNKLSRTSCIRKTSRLLFVLFFRKVKKAIP